MDDMDRTNHGMILAGAAEPDLTAPYTLIVSGVARSGTSMLATILHTAGVTMGDPPLDVVIEDGEILAAARSGQDTLLRQIIARRDAAHAVWGFKLPNLPSYLPADRVAWFRNPRMILIYRDPVAVAVRDSLSEYFDPRATLVSTLHGMIGMIGFAERVGCPTLMLSYEKAIASPERTVRAVLRFCGLRVSDDMMADLVLQVQPDNPVYLKTAHSRFAGYIDGIARDHLIGWCRNLSSLEPVELDLIVNNQVLTKFVAMEYRQDLADQRIGNGNHGFRLDVRRFNLPPDTVLRVRPTKRLIELSGSGQTIQQLAAGIRTDADGSVSPTPVPAAAQAPAVAPQPPLPASRPKESLGSW